MNEDNDNIGFGYSSPWPVQQEGSYRIVDEDEDDNKNGLGEALNINARLYGNDLYSPETAVKMLLNLLNDDDKVKLELVQDGSSAGTCTVKISFIEDGVDKYVRMIQPWGNDGIWIPQDCEE